MRVGYRRPRPAYVNLLLVSIDSLRGDHLPRTRPDVTTPRFDYLTADFGMAPNCFSVSSATRPVHLSLVTGLYPFEHGILSQRHSRQRRGLPNLFDACRGAGDILCRFLGSRGDLRGTRSRRRGGAASPGCRRGCPAGARPSWPGAAKPVRPPPFLEHPYPVRSG